MPAAVMRGGSGAPLRKAISAPRLHGIAVAELDQLAGKARLEHQVAGELVPATRGHR